MTDQLKELRKAFFEAQWADFVDQERETMGGPRDDNRAWDAGMSAVLAIVEREHAQHILQAIGRAYANGARDSQALTELGF